MKFLLLFTLLATTFALHSKSALEIHIFSVGQADSQLVVFPSGYSILIDCGDRDYSGAKHTKHVASRIETILGHKKIDVFVITHFHGDHTGKKGKNGIWYLLEKKGFTVKKFLKREAATYSGSDLSDCNKDTLKYKYAGEMSSDMAKFICYAVSSKDKTKLSKVAENAHRCNDDQIKPSDSGAKVTVLIRDALGIKDNKTGKKLSRNSRSDGDSKVAENDFSICMRIQYGKFVYATCGDLSGQNDQGSSKKFHDVESSVASMMGEVDVYNVNHHGSGTSTNTKWAKTLKPTVSVISCGDDLSLPSRTPMKNLKNVGSKVYTTGKDCNQDKINEVGGIIEMGDDVVITVPKDGKKFTVASPSGKNKKTYTIKTDKKAATKCKLLDE